MNDYETILTRMQEVFEAEAGMRADDASDIGIRLRVLAGEIAAACAELASIERQAFPQTAEGQALDRHAQQRGITRKEAVPATGMLTFSREGALTYDAAIPAGTVCAAPGEDGARVATLRDAVLPAGDTSVSVEAAAQMGGKAGNAAVGAIRLLLTPPPGITAVNNTAPFTGGADAESDEELRLRVLQSYRNIPNGTNAAFYREVALGYPGVYSVSVVPRARGRGTVDVYAAAKGAALGDALLAEIAAALAELREINVDVQVKSPALVAVKLVVRVLPKEGFTMETVRADCEEALRAYFSALHIGEPVLLAAAGEALYHLPCVANYAFETTLCGDRAVTQKELAVPGALNIAQWEVQ